MPAPAAKFSAVVTGASSGIGRAIAVRLGAGLANLCLIGRTPAKLESLYAELAHSGDNVHVLACDLDKEDDVTGLVPRIERLFPRIDVLVHAAGVITLAPLATLTLDDLDRHFRVNVRAPLLLTQLLLPALRAARGQVVFINSSLGTRSKENCGAYAASKHALKAIADTLRLEVNAAGVRVLSVFPGNTATPMQAALCRAVGKPFEPAGMLQPDDVATAVVNSLMLPRTAELTDLHIRPAQTPTR